MRYARSNGVHVMMYRTLGTTLRWAFYYPDFDVLTLLPRYMYEKVRKIHNASATYMRSMDRVYTRELPSLDPQELESLRILSSKRLYETTTQYVLRLMQMVGIQFVTPKYRVVLQEAMTENSALVEHVVERHGPEELSSRSALVDNWYHSN